MNNIFESDKIATFKSYCDSSERIVIVSHSNPDGDAIGSGLALLLFLRSKGYNVRFFVPNHFPQFLAWVDSGKDTEIYCEMSEEATAYLAAADHIICVDFNSMPRLEKMAPTVESNVHAKKTLIDHHIEPARFDLLFSDVSFSSTSHMVYHIIKEWCKNGITLPIAGALYVGMMTDTGGFSFGNLTGDLFRSVAELIDAGVDAPMTHRLIYNTSSESRLRMIGYLMCDKLKVFPAQNAAYISISREEKKRFNHQIGDTEGIANLPLSIAGIRFSALLIETTEFIKISLRSQGDCDVNALARLHFNGGGHKNAAGGRLSCTMAQAIALTEQIIGSLNS